MDPTLWLPVTLSWLAFSLILLSIRLAPTFISRKVKASIKDIPGLVLQLQTAQARAAGTLATAARRTRQADDDQDDADDDEEPSLGALGPMVMGLATQFGIDPSKVMAGDPGELAKVQQVLGQLKPQGGQVAPTSSGGYL